MTLRLCVLRAVECNAMLLLWLLTYCSASVNSARIQDELFKMSCSSFKFQVSSFGAGPSNKIARTMLVMSWYVMSMRVMTYEVTLAIGRARCPSFSRLSYCSGSMRCRFIAGNVAAAAAVVV